MTLLEKNLLWSIAVSFGLAANAVQAQDKKPTAPVPPASIGATMTAHVLLTPADLKWVEGPPSLPPGAKVALVEGDPKAANALFTMRIKLPANYKVMPHFHPADEHVTVISGAFWMGMGNKFDPAQTKELPPGAFAVMPVGHHHFAMTKIETEIQVHGVGPWGITYVNPSDDPRTQAKPKK